jgi:chromosome segregation ATPase
VEFDAYREWANGEMEMMTRTIKNIKASLEQRDAEVAEIENEASRKIDEKRRVIKSLEERMTEQQSIVCGLMEDLQEARRVPHESRPSDEPSAAVLQQQVSAFVARERELKAAYDKLVGAVSTMRSQLIAVDSLNKHLSLKNEALEKESSLLRRQFEDQKADIRRLQEELQQLRAERHRQSARLLELAHGLQE